MLPIFIEQPPPPILLVAADDVEITRDCTVRINAPFIEDTDGDGVIHIVADGVTVVLEGELAGAPVGRDPDAFTGTGIRITGRDVTLRGAVVRGYKTGIFAQRANGLVVEDCDVSGNFRQRLRSTPRAEDAADWLRPHENDANEWMHRYGAGLYVEETGGATIRRVVCRRGQNGIILDRVSDSEIYDNDCSFLSGWGLGLWRSSGNRICRNAFDFCVRGYSHGVYNRGQDSAGILMFEQCSGNLIAGNSVTHGGDGLFAFAGREALGEATAPPDAAAGADPLAWYRRRGNNTNVFLENDFSYAAAHGLELTFSFDNVIAQNTFRANAICGIWGGYSQSTRIIDNRFEENGEAGYGPERGGVNIEHGSANVILGNVFEGNACGVFLWWDEDASLMALPWARANERGSSTNAIVGNRFTGDAVAIQLRQTTATVVQQNEMVDVPVAVDHDEGSAPHASGPAPLNRMPRRRCGLGETQPVGARPALAGREHIVMTEWGPYDWREPLLRRVRTEAGAHAYELLGSIPLGDAVVTEVSGEVESAIDGDRVLVRSTAPDSAAPYSIRVDLGGARAEASGLLVDARWLVRVFAYETDPRIDVDEDGHPSPRGDEADRYRAWRREAEASGFETTLSHLDLPFAGGGPSDLDLGPPIDDAALPADRFGTIATTTLTLPAGRWRLRTLSDDGIRVRIDGTLVIDDWTWHPPRPHEHLLDLPAPRTIAIEVEHFELDGYAVLAVEIEGE